MLNIGKIEEGFVLDHIQAGMAMSIYHHLMLDKLDCTVAIIKNARSNKMEKKDIIKVECDISMLDLDVLGFIDHNITVNVIKNGEIVEKKELHLPPPDQKCHPLQKPPLHHFHRAGAAPYFRPGRQGKGNIPLQIL